MIRLLLAPVLTGVAALVSAPAFAHHPMGGTTPSSLAEGLLSGFGHPVIGLDHFAFIVAAGLLAAPRNRAFLLPIAFTIASFAGSLLHLGSVDLPGGELLIAGSVIIMGLLLVSSRRIGDGLFAGLLGLAGLLHGHALAEAIIGAEPTPLVAYLSGLALTEYGIAAAVVLGWRALSRVQRDVMVMPRLNRLAGAVVTVIGTVTLVLNAAA